MTEWVVAPLLVVLAFWLPGLLVVQLGGVRLHVIDLVAVAPAVTIGVCALTAETARVIGIRWGIPAAVVGTGLASAVAVLLRRRAGQRPTDASRREQRDSPAVVVAVAAAIGIQLVVVLGAMGDPRLLLTANDAGAHMTMVRGVIETGQASAFTVAGAHEIDGIPRAFYPAGWHAVTGLAATGSGVAATFTWAWLLPAVIAWTCGIVALTRASFPQRPAILIWAALISGPGVALPLTLTLTPEGMVPNTVGAALVPGVLASLVGGRGAWPSTTARRVLGVLAVAGLGAVHPNAALALALLGAGWWVPALARGVRDRWSAHGWRKVAMLAGSAVFLMASAGLAVLAARNPEIRFILSTHDEGALTPDNAVWGLVTLDATFMTVGCGFVLFLAGVAGAVLVWRRRGRWMAVGAAVMATFFLAASSDVPVLSALDAPWYDESRRYAPVIVAGFLPLSAYGAHVCVRWLAAHARAGARSLVGGALTIVALLGVLVPGSASLWSVVRPSYHGANGSPSIADENEMALLDRLPHELSGGAVLSGPFSGGSYLYALSGYPVVPRDASTTVTAPLRDLVLRMHNLGTDPQVCDDLNALGVRYLYVDPTPWHAWDALPLDRQLAAPPASGVRLVDQAGHVRVYEITACD